MEKKVFSAQVGGRELIAEFNDMALQADGSCLVRYGDTMVLATAVMAKEAKTGGGDFFPLTVDYEEKYYAAGEILGSRFIRREGRPSEEAVLVSRLIDRTIRPLFNSKIRNAVHVVVMALSADGVNDPDIPAIVAASLALGTSDIPWAGPVSAVRIGGGPSINSGQATSAFFINPTHEERQDSAIDMVICGKDGKINMVEAGCLELAEERAVDALNEALKHIAAVEDFQKKIIAEIGQPKRKIEFPEEPKGMRELFKSHFRERLDDIIYIFDKATRNYRIGELKKEWFDAVAERFGTEIFSLASEIFEEEINDIVHDNILTREKRPDSRKLDEVRDLQAQVALLPRAHGSGLFYRGETHILSAVTLGAPGDVQLVEGMEVRTKKRFMHHYNFPPFSTGEVGRMGSPGRREIGHGALAERALEPVLPPKDQFPYTVRIVSEALSSNGSTSMGSVCASTLAMMDAGIPIKKPVAGIAMGLMVKDENNFKVLTDIQGPEDHHGDMDFKAAGTKDGITAIQMDVKVEGVTVKMLEQTLKDAKSARLRILDVMLKTIPEPRAELPKHAPRIIVFHIDPEKIRDVIGPGGKVINKIIETTGAEIDIEQDGSIFITAESADSANDALEQIKLIVKEFAVGEKAGGVVTRIFEFGAMVEIAPKKEGLIHISELAPWRVNKVTDVINIGDIVPVQVIGIDEQGRINLSLKAVKTIEKPEGYVESERPSGGFRPRRDHDGGGRGFGSSGGHSRSGPRRRF